MFACMEMYFMWALIRGCFHITFYPIVFIITSLSDKIMPNG